MASTLRPLMILSFALISLSAQAAQTSSGDKTEAPLAASTAAMSAATPTTAPTPTQIPSLGPITLTASNVDMYKNSALITQSNFKQWFKLDVPGKATSTPDIKALIDTENKLALQQLQAYYQKLRQCVPGAYSYPLPNPRASMLPNQSLFLLGKSTIEGSKQDKCSVTNNLLDQADQVCHFTSDHLNSFTDTQAVDDLKNPLTVDRSKMFAIVKQDCTIVDPVVAKAAYIKALASCSPGSFKYSVPSGAAPLALMTGQTTNSQDTESATSVIVGSKDGLCVVDTTSRSIASLHCAYSKGSIDFMIKKQNAPVKPNVPGQNSMADVSVEDVDKPMQLMQECGLMPKI